MLIFMDALTVDADVANFFVMWCATGVAAFSGGGPMWRPVSKTRHKKQALLHEEVGIVSPYYRG